MPLDNDEVIGAETPLGSACIHCTNERGEVRSCAEVFAGGVQFFMGIMPSPDRNLAKRITRKNMRQQPYWQANPCELLNGDEATDEEFEAVLAALKG